MYSKIKLLIKLTLIGFCTVFHNVNADSKNAIQEITKALNKVSFRFVINANHATVSKNKVGKCAKTTKISLSLFSRIKLIDWGPAKNL